MGMKQAQHDTPQHCSPQRMATAIATCNLRTGPQPLIRHESLRTSLNDCDYAEVEWWLAPHLEFLSLGGPSMRPSTFVSSTSRSALSSLASSLARLSLSWNPLDLSCKLRWCLGTEHWFAGVFRH